ncbi:Protocatechuate 3,4-dioxygenase beta chain [Planctomycetes bacterium MalM25]|nr:Protocatechuate 3,4-dioxygenase beta chain [Planctomycetes bacterium MalM25]
MPFCPQRVIPRRGFLSLTAQTGVTAAALAALPAHALADLMATPTATEGPFYPDRLPLDTDNDLLIVNEKTAQAVGDVTHLSGRVLSRAGEPIRSAVVEIWQVDSQGAYLHSQGESGSGRDSGFQGYGRFLTDSSGAYYFRTIRPVPYPGRTPHIHFAVSQNGHRVLTTQLFIAGHKQNAGDGLYRAVGGEAERAAVTREWRPIPDSPLGEYEVGFDLVLGVTPAEGDDGKFPGVVAPSSWGRSRRGRRG